MTVTYAPAGAALVLVLLGACTQDSGAPDTDDAGQEVSDPAELETEGGDATESAEAGGEAVSVELPGLPIGGDEVAFFDEPATQCATITPTEVELPPGLTVVITALDAPPPFAVSSDPCGSGPPCLGGAELTVDSPLCEVAVSWDGSASAEAELVATRATARCDAESPCADLVAAVEGAGALGVDVTATLSEEEPDPSESSDEPTS